MNVQFEAVETAVAAELLPGTIAYRHEGVFDRCRIAVTYAVDLSVHRARRDAGLGAVRNERLLAALMSLPADALGVVGEQFHDVFDEPSTAGYAVVVEAPDGRRWGQRRLEPAVRVLEIETQASSWRRGRALADVWAGYGARTVAITGPFREPELSLLEASYFGIGVKDARAGQLLLAPKPYRPRRWTSARWRFAELVYGQFLEVAAARSL